MRITAVILGLLIVSIGSQAQSQITNYSGKVIVEGLGKIAFPEGEWSLEFRRIHAPADSVDLPDYFVFKKLGDRLERLTFLRYLPTTPPPQLLHVLHPVMETMGDGIPWEEKNEQRNEGEVHPMRLEPPSPANDEREIAFSFIRDQPSVPPWLCHSLLFLHERSVFVIAHASSAVISPQQVHDVRLRSQFFPDSQPPRK